MKHFDLVIVGGAAGSIHFLAELSHRATLGVISPPTVAIIDPQIRPEGGSPHSDPSRAFRVNMRNNLHNITGQSTLTEFLNQYGGHDEDPPLRADLGRYLDAAKRQSTINLEAFGSRVIFIRATVTSLQRELGGEVPYRYRLMLGNEDSIGAKTVVLATGNEAPTIPSNVKTLDGSLTRVRAYCGGSTFAHGIESADRVLVLGTGPGGVDVSRYLIEETDVKAPIILASRRGLLSAVQAVNPPAAQIVADVAEVVRHLTNRDPVNLQDLSILLTPLFRKYDPLFDFRTVTLAPANAMADLAMQIAAAAQDGPAWRQVLEGIGSRAAEIWGQMSSDAKLEFLQNWERLYYVKRHAMQMKTARWLGAQMSLDRIRVARLTSDVLVSGGGISTSVEFLPGGECSVIADRLVVATAPEYRLSHSRNPLIRQLLDTGLASACTTAGIEIGGFQTHDLELAGLPGVFAMGSAVRGEYYATHSFPALAKHAGRIIDVMQARSLL